MLLNQLGERETYYECDNLAALNAISSVYESAPLKMIQPYDPYLIKDPNIKDSILRADADLSIKANAIAFNYPAEFTQSTNQYKRVEVLNARLIEMSYDEDADKTVYDIRQGEMYSNITSNSHSFFITQLNPAYFIRKTFIIGPNNPFFIIWFRDTNGDVIDLSLGLNDSNHVVGTRVIVELKITY